VTTALVARAPVRYPCDYVDKGGLAVTDGARGCSGTPTWQLVVTGALDPAHVRSALADVVTRYPSLTTTVHALDGAPLAARRFAYIEDPAFSIDAIFRVVEARDEGALAALVRDEENRHLDLFRDAPMTLTLARTGDDRCRLLFRQHHAIADGRAFIALLVDFAAFLDAARAGRRPPPEALAPIHRRDELAPLSLPPLRRFGWRLAGYLSLLGVLWRAFARPTVALLQNRSNDYTGENGAVRWILGDDVLTSWNAARKRLGVSLNSLLTGALFCANQRWHRARGAPLGRTTASMIMETRPRDGGFVSFANHLATLEVEVALDRVGDAAAMARAVQAAVDEQRRSNRPFKRLLAERALVLGMTLAQLQRLVFETKHPSYNLNFSNLIALDFPTLDGDGWLVDEVLITTPVTPRTGIALTAIRYHGRLCFNFNYKSSAATRAEVEALCAEFQTVVTELVAQRP
jgi:condensation domain-containing protein/uncharacterized protein DUF1298